MPPMHPAMEREMAEGSYNQFCPVAMAAEILCTRWTIVLLRELVAGSTRFNELRRGVPRMSPALLSKRLKDLEAAGIVSRSQLAGDPACIPRPARHAGTLPARRLQNHILPNKSGEAGPLGQSDSAIYC